MNENADDVSEDPPAQATGGRRRLLLLIVAGVLLFGAGAATAFFLMRGDDDATATRPWVPREADSPLNPNEYGATEIQKHCLDPGGKQTVVAYFDGDDPDPVMREAAEALRADDRIAWVRTETRQQAYERFKELFAEQPEMVDLVRPQSLPASVTLLPTDGVYPGDLADAITDEFSEIGTVSAGCELPE